MWVNLQCFANDLPINDLKQTARGLLVKTILECGRGLHLEIDGRILISL